MPVHEPCSSVLCREHIRLQTGSRCIFSSSKMMETKQGSCSSPHSLISNKTDDVIAFHDGQGEQSWARLHIGCGAWDFDSLPRIKIPHILCLETDNITVRKVDARRQPAFHKAVYRVRVRPICCLEISQHKAFKQLKVVCSSLPRHEPAHSWTSPSLPKHPSTLPFL